MEMLPYALPYELIPFAKPDGTSAGTYNDLVYQVFLEVINFFRLYYIYFSSLNSLSLLY